MFFAFSQKQILAKGRLSGNKRTKPKKAATQDLYYFLPLIWTEIFLK